MKTIEERAFDIETIPQLYVRWLMIDGEKPSWDEYANRAMENYACCKNGEGRLRPYQSREELLDAMKEHGDYVVWKYNLDWNLRILGFSNKRVNIEGHNNTTMEEAMKGFRWADGHPFGKEEQL